MPASNAPGLSHFPFDRFPTDAVPSAVLDNLPISDVLGQAAPTSALDAAGLSHLPLDLFPTDHFPDVGWQYLPFADLF